MDGDNNIDAPLEPIGDQAPQQQHHQPQNVLIPYHQYDPDYYPFDPYYYYQQQLQVQPYQYPIIPVQNYASVHQIQPPPPRRTGRRVTISSPPAAQQRHQNSRGPAPNLQQVQQAVAPPPNVAPVPQANVPAQQIFSFRTMGSISASIEAVVDQNDVFSRYNLVEKEFSDSCSDLVDNAELDEEIYNSVWEIFAHTVPQNCCVYVILDAKDIKIPNIDRTKDSKYPNQPDTNDSLIGRFNVENYLDAVVAIGIENDLNRLYYTLLKDVVTNGDVVKEKIQELLKQDTGLFVQTIFNMSTIKECMLRKVAMLVAINRSYSTKETFNEVKGITDDVIPDLSGLQEYGAVCWKKAYRMFLAQPPSCLTKDIVCRKKNKVV